MDVGTGDGRLVIREAHRDPRALVVGVDANASAMREAARRAAAKQSRGGCPNAIFVVAAVEALPAGMAGFAGRVTVNFPWGSLLRGCLGQEPAVLHRLAVLLDDGAELEALVSLVDRDGLVSPSEEHLRVSYRAASLDLQEYRQATSGEIATCRSSWARRLGAGLSRPVWRITAVRRRQHARAKPGGW